MESVTLEDEVVFIPGHGSGPMRAGKLFGASNRLVNTHTRMIVAWYGSIDELPRRA